MKHFGFKIWSHDDRKTVTLDIYADSYEIAESLIRKCMLPGDEILSATELKQYVNRQRIRQFKKSR